MLRRPVLSCVFAGALLAAGARAQLGTPWVTFSKQPANLALAPLVLSDSDTQVVFRTGDLDQDGWDDVVAVRKQQASQLGKRPSFVLMNLHGVLTDKTAQYAVASDTPGDQGFLTPRNTRECALGDVNLDGWLDVVTANSLSDGDPKHLSHPAVLRNRAGGPGAAWLGLRHEHARIPQLFTVGGQPVAPRFCGMGVSDVTGDGAPDAYFVDYDGTETGIPELAGTDLNDRLLVNDGNGYFTDESLARLTTQQLKSGFGADVELFDVNADGLVDILKDSTLDAPIAVRAIYNNPADVGNFTVMGVSSLGSDLPYGIDVGNLNNDAIADVAIADDSQDRFRLGTGYDALNRVVWGPLKVFTFLNGIDDGFGHNVYMRDLDDNGWEDVLITDVDGDVPGCNQRRMHIYHNLGSVPGDMNLVLQEEVELASGYMGAGWKGVVGMGAADAKGCFDVGFGDFDRDGDVDMLVATCSGTQYFRNETYSVVVHCQQDLGFGGPGAMQLSVCGENLALTGSVATLSLSGAAPNAPLFIPVSLSANPLPFKGGMLVPVPVLQLASAFTDGAGGFSAIVTGAGGTPVHVILQCIVKVGGAYELSNALDCLLGA